MTETARRVTAADIARSLGLSRATVGFVLNDTPGQTISAATRERVLAEAQRLGYRPHRAARALASGQSRIVMLVLPDWPMEYSMASHLEEASHALDVAGYSLVTWTPHTDSRARPLWETLQPDVVMGLLPFPAAQAAAIRRSGAVVVGAEDDAPGESLGFSRGPELQVRRLVEQGIERLVHVTTSDPRLRVLAGQRAEIATTTAASLGLPLEVVRDDAPLPDLVASWAATGRTGVVAYNDDVAAAVVGAALRTATPVPERIAVVGHDDAPIARLFVPSLTTVRIDTAGLGRYVAALALHAATGSPAPQAGPETSAELVRRESA